jgi:hypothetical protein
VQAAVREGRSAFVESEAVLAAVDDLAHRSADSAARIGRSTVDQGERAQHLTDIVGALAATAEENAATRESAPWISRISISWSTRRVRLRTATGAF